MKQIMQFRYYMNNNEYNSPSSLTWDKLASGTLFNDYGPVCQLGIQGPPGLRFYLNNGAHSIMIGQTGIYELDMDNTNRITAIKFHREDRDLITESNKLIVDIVYERSGS